jgi:Putative zinc-binding metallo-peptidase
VYGAKRAMKSAWYELEDEELLDMRLCDLPLRIEGTPLEERVERLYDELAERGLRLRPHVWLSEEWFSPDGVGGFAIPFYLAHPRLMKLERALMLEVEGGTDKECMRIMRHEAGHALSNAFRLHHRRRWRELFGRFTEPYPAYYQPQPNSRDYVLHLGAWYAQAHPAEDFAETFAVWLAPGSRWQKRYVSWPAMQKLRYVDELMAEIAGRRPPINGREAVEPLPRITKTLREHYRRKRHHYSFQWPAYYDRDLKRIFSAEENHRARPTAASLLRRHRRELRHLVADVTGVHHYAVDHVLKNMIDRCKALRLRVPVREPHAKQRALIMLTAHTMNIVHAGYHRIPL